MSSTADEWNPPGSISGKIKYVLLTVGPMAILMSASMGPGTISSLTVAGSTLGFSALWLALISGWLGAVVYYVGGKVCAITGETPVELIHRYTHPVFTYVLMGVLLYVWYFVIWSQGNILSTTTGLLVPPLDPYTDWLVTPLLILLIAFIFIGGFDTVKAVLSAFTVFMATVYIVNAIYVTPDLGSMTSGLVPELLDGSNGASAFAGILGGSVGIGPIWYAYIANDNDWGKDQLKFMAADQIVFYGILFTIFSVGIYVSAAATLQGIAVNGAVDAAIALEPVGGELAALLFGLGLWAAAFTTIGGMSAVAAYLVTDLINHLPVVERDIPLSMDSSVFKAVIVLGVISSTIGPFLSELPALPLMVYAISLFNVIAPTTILIFTIAVLRKRDVGEFAGPWYLVAGLFGAFGITLYSVYSLENPLYFQIAIVFIGSILIYTGYREVTDSHVAIHGRWARSD